VRLGAGCITQEYSNGIHCILQPTNTIDDSLLAYSPLGNPTYIEAPTRDESTTSAQYMNRMAGLNIGEFSINSEAYHLFMKIRRKNIGLSNGLTFVLLNTLGEQFLTPDDQLDVTDFGLLEVYLSKSPANDRKLKNFKELQKLFWEY
jgi:hypothetical protein